MNITMQDVESSQIQSVGYDAASQTLAIRFNTAKGFSEYHYANVPQEIYDGLMRAESHGRYFGQNIKPFPDLYPYEKQP